jgi:aminoglycoside 6'-N-acetyltransferase I
MLATDEGKSGASQKRRGPERILTFSGSPRRRRRGPAGFRRSVPKIPQVRLAASISSGASSSCELARATLHVDRLQALGAKVAKSNSAGRCGTVRGMADALLIRPVQPSDADVWERMREALWPSAPGEHAGEIARYFSGVRLDPAEVLLACLGSGAVVGFIELSIRSHAASCDPGRVAFVEGWFVNPDARGRGVGAALMVAAQEWGRANRCTELASDAEIGNTGSIAAHLALGFAEVDRVVCFRKEI